MNERHIVGIGGWDTEDEGRKLADYVLSLVESDRPKVLFVPTAQGDSAEGIVRFYEGPHRGRAELSHVSFFPYPPDDVRELALSQQVIVVAGGNTANMLAIWRLHGFDRILREAWEAGIVLSGSSAGMICWFEACVTDSFGPQLEGMRDGLGLLAGSACPHYDGEDRRRPVYQRLVAEGFPPGIAADDGVCLHYVGTELAEVVCVRDGAQAYRVEPGSETPIEPRLL